ncbi:MAG: 2TM domain-containing protein [Variovorax sp.]|nr:MAG: 2TM domain-containing protein [Variovorax sp.]
MNHPASDASPSDLDRLARRRAGAKMGWYVHASVYVLVNLALAGLSAARGHAWAVHPLLGWGLGLLVHGAVVWFAASGSGLHERLVARERRALGERNRDRA